MGFKMLGINRRIYDILKKITVHLHFAQKTARAIRISFRIRRMSSVIVIDDVPSIVGTRYDGRIKHRRSVINSISKT